MPTSGQYMPAGFHSQHCSFHSKGTQGVTAGPLVGPHRCHQKGHPPHWTGARPHSLGRLALPLKVCSRCVLPSHKYLSSCAQHKVLLLHTKRIDSGYFCMQDVEIHFCTWAGLHPVSLAARLVNSMQHPKPNQHHAETLQKVAALTRLPPPIADSGQPALPQEQTLKHKSLSSPLDSMLKGELL